MEEAGKESGDCRVGEERQALTDDLVLHHLGLALGSPRLDARAPLGYCRFVDEHDGATFGPALF